jgi:hypothetical protein
MSGGKRYTPEEQNALSAHSTAKQTEPKATGIKLYEDDLNGRFLNEFKKRLAKNIIHDLIQIHHTLRMYHCKPGWEQLRKSIDNIEVFYLPAYCP